MEIVRRIQSMKEIVRQARGRGLKVGLVPTMGFLHEGHLSLVSLVKERADIVVVSIFVNPTQFGVDEDFESYPRDLTRDADLCIAEGVNYLFVPEAAEMYPVGPRTWVEVGELSERYEGASRPGHFRGVSTVVLKLMEIVRPTVAAFGEKDAQQLAVLRRMVADLMLDVELVAGPIVRADDGVALSSRNRRLTPDQRKAATAIPRSLEAGRQALADGAGEPVEILGRVRETLESESVLAVDYAALVDPGTLQPVVEISGDMLLLIAVQVGETRLLDNTLLSTPKST
jgi:pantoate--beta-alanine ligase